MRKWGFAVLLILGMAAGAWSYLQFTRTVELPQLESVLIYTEARTLKDFKLNNQLEQSVGPEQLRGQWTLAFVGYTFCPDICPMTLAMLSGAYPELQQSVAPEKLALWFISVDPKRDTPQVLKEYVGYFQQPQLQGLSANHDQLYPFVRELGLMYAINNSNEEDYRVDHSGSVVLIDPQGQLRAVFKPEMQLGTVPVVNKAQLSRDFPLVMNYLKQ